MAVQELQRPPMGHHWCFLQGLGSSLVGRLRQPGCCCQGRPCLLGLLHLRVRQDQRRGRQFVALAAMTSFVPESMLLELMEDSRVPMRRLQLEAALKEEIVFLSEIKDS
eukprot:6499460-Alexandrium_andersonii.AAC.1